MEVLVVLIPAIIFITLGCFGRFIGRVLSYYLVVILFSIMFLITMFMVYYICIKNNNVYIQSFTLFNMHFFSIEVGFIFDSLSVVMMLIVVFISFCVHVYSFEYMKNDPNVISFISYLSLFTFSMLVLVSSNNFIQLFIGWEGVGICSYLLISFWYTRVQASKASLKAILLNRVGDIFILFYIALLLYFISTTNISVLAVLTPYMCNFKLLSCSVVEVLAFLLFTAAIAKSAQFGLHTWLPDAMEGPTPVSALLHAATMVTVGIFLIVRCSFLFEFAPISKFFVSLVGILTVLLAGTVSIMQTDIKKIIAYSTCSQIGYMMFVCGTSGYIFGIFHLFNHAFFKALLFLTAGVVIHSLSDNQNIFRMFKLSRLLPLSFLFMMVGNISLAGCIFLSGFYSKDFIIETSLNSIVVSGSLLYWFSLFLSFILTNQYSTLISNIYSHYTVRVMLNTSLYFRSKTTYLRIHEMSITYFLILFLLVLLSVFSGYFFSAIFLLHDSYFFSNSVIDLSVSNKLVAMPEFLPTELKILPVLCAMLVTFRLQFVSYRLHVRTFFYRKWFSDYLNNSIVSRFLYESNETFVKTIDRGLLVDTIMKFTSLLSKNYTYLNFSKNLDMFDVVSVSLKFIVILISVFVVLI